MDEKGAMNKLENPAVSVVIPFYNSEKYLRETIESVLGQQFTGWELILADDGSTDKSTRIAKEYASRFPGKIFYAEHENHRNKAAAASRNLGIKTARAAVVAFLDADDVWLPEYLQNQLDLMEKNPLAAMICEATKYWHSWNDAAQKDFEIRVGAASEQLYQPPELVKKLYPLGFGMAPAMCGIVIKKSALEAVGGFEESFTGSAQVYEDQAFLTKIYLRENIYVSSNCNNLYRQRAGSVMAAAAANNLYHEARLFFLEWFKDYLQTQQINDLAVRKLLRKAFRRYRHPLVNKFIEPVAHRWRLINAKFSH